MKETVITITGNVVDTPQRRKTDAGHSVASFRIASTERRYDKSDGQWVDGDSLYLKVTCWRALADNVDRSVVQGDPVIVTGRLYTRSYEVEGQRRSSYELEANALGLDLSRGVAAFTRTKTAGPTFEVNDAPETGSHGGAADGDATDGDTVDGGASGDAEAWDGAELEGASR